jgi:uncharacterized protein
LHNRNSIEEIHKFFKDNYDKVPSVGELNNMQVIPAFVEDIKSCKVSDCLFDRKRRADFIMEIYKKYGLNYFYFYPSNDRYECAIRNPYCLTIGPQGEIYKCWNDVGRSDKVIAKLDKSIKINHRLNLRYLTGADPLDDPKCRSCFHFPTCGGGCPYLRIENEYNNENFDNCGYIKDNMKQFLELHYQYKIQQNQEDINQ